ncbi:MAG TPA: PH domain-containing protein [Bacilli bacterium]|nr:PH domain-containing protein [Bacilli bacterium]
MLVPLFLLYGWMCFRDAGWQLEEGTFLFRFRRLTRTTAVVPRRRLQTAQVRQSLFQKRVGLATFSVSVVSGNGGVEYRVVDVDEDVSEALLIEAFWREE